MCQMNLVGWVSGRFIPRPPSMRYNVTKFGDTVASRRAPEEAGVGLDHRRRRGQTRVNQAVGHQMAMKVSKPIAGEPTSVK